MPHQNVYILITVFLLLFTPGIFCGWVVDDVVRMPLLNHIRKQFNWSVQWFRWYLVEGLYGAGLFNDSRLDHGFNLIIHLFNCLLINSLAGFCPALLYMINPVNNQVTLWLNGRRYLLSIFSVLMAWKFKWLGLIFFPFTAWLHVSGIAFPLLYLSTPEWYVAIGLIGLGLICGYKRLSYVVKFRMSEFAKPDNGEINECQKFTWKKSILYVKSIGWYVINTIFPFKPAMYNEFLYYFNRYEEGLKEGYSLNGEFWVGALILGGLISLIVVGHSFWAFWFLLFISQYCNVFTLTMTAAERYCSLSGIGLMVLLSQGIEMIPDHGVRLSVYTAFCVMYALKYIPLFRAYSTYGNFLRYNVEINPAGVEARHVMAINYLNQPKPCPMSAYVILKDGLRYRPNDFKLLLVMAQVMFTLGQIERGLLFLNKAEKVIPLGDENDAKKEFQPLRDHFNGILKAQKMMEDIGKQGMVRVKNKYTGDGKLKEHANN